MKTKLTTIATMMIAIFASFSLNSCQTEKSIDPLELEGFWVLKTMNGKEAKSLFAGAVPTIQFDFKTMNISGTGGCNRYNGTFTFEKNTLSAPNIAATQMLCFEDNAEPQYFIELAKENKLSIVNGILTMTNRDKEVVLEFEKGEMVDESPVIVEAEQLVGTWTLKRLEGMEASEIFTGENATIPTLVFDIAENKIMGHAGCNRYNTSFTLNNDVLVIPPAMTTKMACPNLEGETKYLKNLADTVTVSLPNPNVLLLMKNEEAILEFEKIKE